MMRRYANEDKAVLMELMQLNTPDFFHASEIADFELYLSNELEDYFIIEEDGEVVGGGGLNYPEPGLARISWDMIHPEHHGKGLGSTLLSHRIEFARKRPGVKSLDVRTTQLVYPFYEKHGFQMYRSEKDYWAPGFDLYHLVMNW